MRNFRQSRRVTLEPHVNHAAKTCQEALFEQNLALTAFDRLCELGVQFTTFLNRASIIE
jgi:hypothetical protein